MQQRCHNKRNTNDVDVTRDEERRYGKRSYPDVNKECIIRQAHCCRTLRFLLGNGVDVVRYRNDLTPMTT